jgi:hypothetical protein
MNSSEITNQLLKFPNIEKKFQGIFSADNLPKHIKNKHFIICNTDLSSGEGKHWYSVVKISSNTLEIFDSLGIQQEKKHIIQNSFRQKSIEKIKFNVTQLQSSSSTTCGQFVLFYLINRYHNLDLNFTDLINEIFVLSENENEEIVKKIYVKHFT